MKQNETKQDKYVYMYICQEIIEADLRENDSCIRMSHCPLHKSPLISPLSFPHLSLGHQEASHSTS